MDVLDERYALRDAIGEGGMARVVEAHDRLLDRRVAVKVLREDIAADPMARVRFLHEARTAARFSHPNAVAVYDSGGDSDAPWIVMELVDGENLSQRLAREGPMDEPDAVAVVDAVLAALDAAHRQGIVHRDVKPENVMLLPDGSVKLADFGIAKSLQDKSTLSGTGQIVGTPNYLSPEQVSGEQTTPASDVYATGVLLYEMLVGSPPYTAEDPIAVAVAHQRQPVPDLGAARPDVSGAVAAVVARALAKDARERYPDAGAMRRALPRPAPDASPVAAASPTAVVVGEGGVMRGGWWLARYWRWAVAVAALASAALFLAMLAGEPAPAPQDTAPAADTTTADDVEQDDGGDGGDGGEVGGEDRGGNRGKAKGKGQRGNKGGNGRGKAKGRD